MPLQTGTRRVLNKPAPQKKQPVVREELTQWEKLKIWVKNAVKTYR